MYQKLWSHDVLFLRYGARWTDKKSDQGLILRKKVGIGSAEGTQIIWALNMHKEVAWGGGGGEVLENTLQVYGKVKVFTGGISIMCFVFFRYQLSENELSRHSIIRTALKVQFSVIQMTHSQSISSKVFKIKKLFFYSFYILKLSMLLSISSGSNFLSIL